MVMDVRKRFGLSFDIEAIWFNRRLSETILVLRKGALEETTND